MTDQEQFEDDIKTMCLAFHSMAVGSNVGVVVGAALNTLALQAIPEDEVGLRASMLNQVLLQLNALGGDPKVVH